MPGACVRALAWSRKDNEWLVVRDAMPQDRMEQGTCPEAETQQRAGLRLTLARQVVTRYPNVSFYTWNTDNHRTNLPIFDVINENQSTMRRLFGIALCGYFQLLSNSLKSSSRTALLKFTTQRSLQYFERL